MKQMNKLSFFYFGLIFWLAFLNAQEVPHEVMDMDCETCHNAKNWKQIEFDHSNTGFPLQGKHRGNECRQCHDLKNFSEIHPECRHCHTDVHRGRLGPWCQACHTPVSWMLVDQTKAHANTTFPLLGVHSRLDCWACHYSEIEGEFSPLKSECYSCHFEDYNSVQSPNHAGSGFSKNCELCHGFYGWKPAQFSEHDGFFPIFSGNHAGVWNQCGDCHINPGSYQIFSCLTCHEHSKDRMDREHREVAGYVYDSNACYNCHPNGIAGDDDD